MKISNSTQNYINQTYANQAVIAAQTEYQRFQRGDYVS